MAKQDYRGLVIVTRATPMRDEPYWKATVNTEDHTGGEVIVSRAHGLPEKHPTEDTALAAGMDYGKRVIDMRELNKGDR